MRSRGTSRQAAPWFLVIPGFLGLALLVLPLVGLAKDVPWSGLWRIWTDPAALTALRISAECATASMVIAGVLGVPLAWLLARDVVPGTGVLRGLVLVPLLLPPVVSGVALLSAFGRYGVVGGVLFDWFGIQVPFSTAAVILAETFVAMPFFIITAEAGFRALNRQYEQAAATLGAGSWMTFRRITIPLMAPALIAGALLTWARALGEFGATITFAGNFQGVTQTLPLDVYQLLESDRAAAAGLSLLTIAVCIVILIVLRGRFQRTAP